MRLKLTIAALMAASALTPAFGQTAVGVGLSNSDATAISGSRSTAIGGGNATGGNARATSNPTQAITITNPANTNSTVNNTGTSTVRNVPAVFAPGLAAAGLETCLGSISGGGAFVGTGFSFGTSIPDPGCAARLDARTLWSFGLKKAAIARLCLGTDIRNAMPDVCAHYLPVAAPVVYAAPPPLISSPGVFAPPPPPERDPGQFSYNSDRSIMLVDGKTGVEHLCTNYDEPKQRCRVWADAVVRTHYAASKKRLRHIDPVTPTVASAASQEDKSK